MRKKTTCIFGKRAKASLMCQELARNIKVRVGRWNRIRLSTLTKKGKVDKTQFSQGLSTA